MSTVETVRPIIAVESKKQADSPKKASKPKAKADKKPKAKKASGSGSRVNDETKLVALKKVSEIEFADGSFCYAQAQAVITSRTIGEAKEKLKADKNNPTRDRRIEIRFLVSRGYVKTA